MSEVLRISSGLRWKSAIVTPTAAGPQTELLFDVNGRHFSLTFDSLPDKLLLVRLMDVRCLAVFAISLEERNWVERGRYQIRVNDDDEIENITQFADAVQWHGDTA